MSWCAIPYNYLYINLINTFLLSCYRINSKRQDMLGILKKLNVVVVLLLALLSASPVFANDLSVANVTLEDRAPSTNSVTVQFDISWDNAWRSKINHDAVWLTFRFYDPSQVVADKKVCQVTASGLNPSGSSVGSNSDLELSVPADKIGAFIR